MHNYRLAIFLFGSINPPNSLNGDEYAQLLGNFIEVVEQHEELLVAIENSTDRIGKLFLSKAANMKCVHQAYCAAHPRAIVILDKYSEQLEAFMERQGAASPGLLVLTTGLSKPFRRLDKYSAMLQELERHMESGHPDRGDTQRSISIYKDIAVCRECTYLTQFYCKIGLFGKGHFFNTKNRNSLTVHVLGYAAPKGARAAGADGTGAQLAGQGAELAGRHCAHGQRGH